MTPLEGFGEKSAENLIGAIERSKEQPFPRVLFALGIRHVGSVTAELIAERFGGEDLLRGVSVEQLVEINGVGGWSRGRWWSTSPWTTTGIWSGALMGPA